jgi:hypothetical protein
MTRPALMRHSQESRQNFLVFFVRSWTWLTWSRVDQQSIYRKIGFVYSSDAFFCSTFQLPTSSTIYISAMLKNPDDRKKSYFDGTWSCFLIFSWLSHVAHILLLLLRSTLTMMEKLTCGGHYSPACTCSSSSAICWLKHLKAEPIFRT